MSIVMGRSTGSPYIQVHWWPPSSCTAADEDHRGRQAILFVCFQLFLFVAGILALENQDPQQALCTARFLTSLYEKE